VWWPLLGFAVVCRAPVSLLWVFWHGVGVAEAGECGSEVPVGEGFLTSELS